MIIGNYQYTIDEKGRLKLPSQFQEELGKVLIITLGIDDTLELRSKEIFDKWLKKLLSKGSFSKDLRKIHRLILGNSFEVAFDNQGRIKIPKSHLNILNSNIVQVLGVGDKIEIISLNNWNNFMKDTGNELLNELVESIYNNDEYEE